MEAVTSKTKPGDPGHKLTFNELLIAMKMVQSDRGEDDPLFDEPIQVGREWLTAYDLRIEDITDECDGSCEHPQCVYALDIADVRESIATEQVPKGYTDEGLHLAVVLWTN